MNQDDFWFLIDSDINLGYDRRLAKLVSGLSKKSESEIHGFEQELRRMLFKANDYGILAAAKIIDGYVSDDSFLYFRCWLIGKGKKIFFETLANPDVLEAYIKDDEATEFEDLLYVATTAAEKKFGGDEFEDPRDVAVEAGLDYEADPEPRGNDWTEDELPLLYPKLWAKFKSK